MLPLLDDCDMNMALDSVAFQSTPPAASIGGALIIDEKQSEASLGEEKEDVEEGEITDEGGGDEGPDEEEDKKKKGKESKEDGKGKDKERRRNRKDKEKDEKRKRRKEKGEDKDESERDHKKKKKSHHHHHHGSKHGREKRRRESDGSGSGKDEPEEDLNDEMIYVRGASPPRKIAPMGSPLRQDGYGEDDPYDEPYEEDDERMMERERHMMDREPHRPPPRRGRFPMHRQYGPPFERGRSRWDRDGERRPMMRPGWRRPELCMYFMQGKCSRGDSCPFSHDATPPRKNELCKFYMMDCCAKKDKCLYLHTDFPCKYFHTGLKCFMSPNCKFSHGPLNDLTRTVLLKHLESAPKEILGDFPRLTAEGANSIVRAVESKHNGFWDPNKKLPSVYDLEFRASSDPSTSASGVPSEMESQDEEKENDGSLVIVDEDGEFSLSAQSESNSWSQQPDLTQPPHYLHPPPPLPQLQEGHIASPSPSHQSNDPEPGDEKGGDGEEVPDFLASLPKTQRELFLRIRRQQQAVARNEAEEEGEQGSGTPIVQDEDWYSDEDEDQGKSMPQAENGKKPATSSPGWDLSKVPDNVAKVLSVLKGSAALGGASDGDNASRFSFYTSSDSPSEVAPAPSKPSDPRLSQGRTSHGSGSSDPRTILPELPPLGPAQDVDLRQLPKVDTDLRPQFGDSDMRQASSDQDMREIGLLRNVMNYRPCREIDASLASHPPVEYFLHEVEVSKVDYSGVKVSLGDPAVHNDPRLRKLLKQLKSLADEDPREEEGQKSSPTQESAQSDPRTKRQTDPRLREGQASESASAEPRVSKDPRTKPQSDPRTVGKADPRLQGRTDDTGSTQGAFSPDLTAILNNPAALEQIAIQAGFAAGPQQMAMMMNPQMNPGEWGAMGDFYEGDMPWPGRGRGFRPPRFRGRGRFHRPPWRPRGQRPDRWQQQDN